MNFEVGGTYRNMKGEYEVLSIDRDQLFVRYKDGSTVTLTAKTQAKIIERLAHEEARALPSDDADTNERFFGTLGYIAEHLIVIEGFSPPGSAKGFTKTYKERTGQDLSQAQSFTVHQDSDKWGVQLRVVFELVGDDSKLGFGRFSLSLAGSPQGENVRRINSKDYVYELFNYGFVMGPKSQQDLTRIAERIPPAYRDAFEAGRRW